VITGFILYCILGVTHAPGWSDPVVSVDIPVFNDTQRKDLVVTNGNHIHQLWSNFEGANPRIGYNIVFPDGSKLLSDTLLCRDVWSAYPSASFSPDSGFIAFWRENSPIWYTVKDEDGNTIIPPTLYTSDGWFTWPMIDSSPDTLGRMHMVFNLSDGSVCYSVMDPGVGEVFRDTIPDSWMGCLVLVDGDRVHIKFNGPDQLADYIQYDLDGNVAIPTVSLAEGFITNSNSSSMAVDYNGDIYVLVKGSPSGGPYRFSLYKVDCETGSLLINGKVIYMAVPGNTIIYPHLLPSPGGDYFYFIWVEDDPILRSKRWIRFAIIDTNGDFIEDPYVAYDYTDEDPQSIERLEATTNEDGDVFANWSWYYSGDDSYYIVLGWFDHNWMGIEDETASVTPLEISLILSSNPFHDFLSIEVTGVSWLSELSVYDISGRMVRALGPGEGSTFLWDGRDDEGNDLPVGTYVIRAEAQDTATAAKVAKL
jgi:hypothetical protein